MVLPVPLGPCSSAVTPRPYGSCSPNFHSCENAICEAHVVHDLAKLLLAIGWQHDIVEREHRLDTLGEVRQALGGQLACTPT